MLVGAIIGLLVGILPLLPSIIGKRERPTTGDYCWMGFFTLVLTAAFAWLAGRPRTVAFGVLTLPVPGWTLVAGFCAIYFFVTVWLVHREVDSFVPDIADLGVFAQGFWATRQRAFFYSSLIANDVDFLPASELLKGPRAFSLFGAHNSPILILLLPFYWLYPHPRTLIVLQSLALSSAPIVLYLIASGLVGEPAAVCIALAFALSGPVLGALFLGWHEIVFAITPLLLAYLFFSQGVFWPFIAMILLACLTKESVPLTTFMFGPLALIRGYSLAWIVTPALLSVAWFALSIWVIIPYFARGRPYVFFGHRYKGLGGSFAAIIRTSISRPLTLLRLIVRPSNLKYLYQLLFPFGIVLPFGNSAALLSLGGFAQVLFSDGNQYALPYKYYSLEAIAFTSVGFAGTIGYLDSRLALPVPFALSASIAALLLTMSSFVLWSRGILWSKRKGNFFKRRPHHAALQEAMDRVPPDAAVMVPLSLVTPMAYRIRLGQESWNYETGITQHYEYFVIDQNDQWRFGTHDKLKYEWLREELAADKHVVLLNERDGVQLFRRTNYTSPEPVRESSGYLSAERAGN